MQVVTPLTNALNPLKPPRSASTVKESILRTTKDAQPITKLHNIKYPKQRTKEITIQEPRPQKLTTPSISYAQATQGNVNNSKTHSEHSENSVPTPQNTDNFTRLEKLIEKQSEQINNLLSLLTLFMDKFIRTEAK